MTEVSIVGVDLAKQSFQLHAATRDGSVVFRRKLSRSKFVEAMAKLPRCVVAMEACATAHYWGRVLGAQGHEVRLIPPVYVKPFVKRQKNDAADAEAIVEAAQRPTMRMVAVKSVDQQARAMLFRTREMLIGQRTQLANALRGQTRFPAALPWRLAAMWRDPGHDGVWRDYCIQHAGAAWWQTGDPAARGEVRAVFWKAAADPAAFYAAARCALQARLALRFGANPAALTAADAQIGLSGAPVLAASVRRILEDADAFAYAGRKPQSAALNVSRGHVLDVLAQLEALA